MLVPVLLALAPMPAVTLPQAPVQPREMPSMREPRVAGPTAFEFRTMSQPHPGSDDRMFPDIAIGALSVDGDTLYVQLTNKGHSATRSSTLIAARAAEGGMRSELVEAKTGRLAPGETRWIPLKGFSVKTASTQGVAFALANASTVSAVARILPSSASTLDRSGQGCGECTAEVDQSNNMLTLSGKAIGHGAPH